MSLFSWFSRRPEAEAGASAPSNSALTHGDATMPLGGAEHATHRNPHGEATSPRRTERLERREQLYNVVRECMLRAGVLAATYKFKVLSLDNRGQQYLIMIDLAWQAARDGQRLSEIEVAIAQAAKGRHGILVTSVYWRMNEHVTAGPSLRTTNLHDEDAVVAVSRPQRLTDAANSPGLQPQELASLREALAKVGASPRPSLHSPAESRQPNWSETMPNPNATEEAPALSATQYGDLH